MGQAREKQKGFTLIELLIVVVVIGILAAIAIPSYQKYVREARRAEAQSILMEIQLKEEKYRANNTSYAAVATVGGPTSNDYYDFSLDGAATSSTYTLQAIAKNGTSQQQDTGCTTLKLSESGVKTPDACWKK